MAADTPTRKTKTLGYIAISAISHSPEWKAYEKAVSLSDKSRTKSKIRDNIKEAMELADDIVIDFIKVDERIMVYQNLEPKKDKARGTDLTHLFKSKK